MSSIPPEMARVRADRLTHLACDLGDQVVVLFLDVGDSDLEAALDRLDALAHDIRQEADR